MWEQQNVLAKLGTSEEAAKVRAKMQSSSLLSDMQAFKVCKIVRYIGLNYLFLRLLILAVSWKILFAGTHLEIGWRKT